uniref:Uncharacterized protein n=1 Tax=Rhizophora mucronata TaxID=61149 RepID=A0A2P2IKV2_RHIMU
MLYVPYLLFVCLKPTLLRSYCLQSHPYHFFQLNSNNDPYPILTVNTMHIPKLKLCIISLHFFSVQLVSCKHAICTLLLVIASTTSINLDVRYIYSTSQHESSIHGLTSLLTLTHKCKDNPCIFFSHNCSSSMTRPLRGPHSTIADYLLHLSTNVAYCK